MSNRIIFTDTDEKLKMMVVRRGSSASRKKRLNTVFNEIYQLSGKTPSELVKIGLDDEVPTIDDCGIVKSKPLSERFITILYHEYYDYLKNKEYNGKPIAVTTIREKLVSYLSIFTEYDIEKPKNINLNIPKKRIRDDDIPTFEDVFDAMNLTKSLRDKAIIIMAVVTGFRVSDLVDLEIQDLISACDIFFEKNEDKTLGNLLKKNPDDIVPCWEKVAEKTKNEQILTITFNTPEASGYLFAYLKDRFCSEIENGVIDEVELSAPLFKSNKNGKLQAKSVTESLNKLNKRLGNERDKNEHYGKFRMHNLRKLFSTTCRRHIPYLDVKSDDTYEGDIVSLFMGHITPHNPLSYAYDAVPKDNPDSYIRKAYVALIPYLSIRPTEVTDYKPQQVKEFEERQELMEKQLEKQAIELDKKDKVIEDMKNQLTKAQKDIERTNNKLSSIDSKKTGRRIKRIIKDYYYNNYGSKQLPKVRVVTCELAYRFAMEDLCSFNDSNEYLESLINKSKVRINFHPDLIDKIHEEVRIQSKGLYVESEFINNTYGRIVVRIGNIGLWDMIKNEKDFKDAVIDYLLLNNYIDDNMNLLLDDTDKDYKDLLPNEDLDIIIENVMLDYL